MEEVVLRVTKKGFVLQQWMDGCVVHRDDGSAMLGWGEECGI